MLIQFFGKKHCEMNGIDNVRLLLDTNPIIISLNNGFSLSNHTYLTSVITELELLSYSGLTDKDEESIHKLLNMFEIIGLNKEIKELTIEIRRKYGLKLPDSIIIATAISEHAKLVTADRQLSKVKELEIVKLEDIIV